MCFIAYEYKVTSTNVIQSINQFYTLNNFIYKINPKKRFILIKGCKSNIINVPVFFVVLYLKYKKSSSINSSLLKDLGFSTDLTKV